MAVAPDQKTMVETFSGGGGRNIDPQKKMRHKPPKKAKQTKKHKFWQKRKPPRKKKRKKKRLHFPPSPAFSWEQTGGGVAVARACSGGSALVSSISSRILRGPPTPPGAPPTNPARPHPTLASLARAAGWLSLKHCRCVCDEDARRSIHIPYF